jgi:hypothetical protein
VKRLLAVAALLAGAPLHAASLGGRIEYPSEELPAMIVVARDAAGRLVSTQTRPGARRYRIEVPAGAWIVYGIPLGTGTPEVRGAHTEYSICARDTARLLAGGCKTGPLVEVRVGAGERREDVDLTDWYLTARAAKALFYGSDPLFQRYPEDATPPASTRPPDFSAVPALQGQRAAIERAANRGPFFAGRVGIARWGCGKDCENWALVDIASGRIDPLEGLQGLRRNLPCQADPIDFRDDSRLMRVRSLDGAGVLVREFAWSYENGRLEPLGRSTITPEELCRQLVIR